VKKFHPVIEILLICYRYKGERISATRIFNNHLSSEDNEPPTVSEATINHSTRHPPPPPTPDILIYPVKGRVYFRKAFRSYAHSTRSLKGGKDARKVIYASVGWH
jgi:hypothetical protein